MLLHTGMSSLSYRNAAFRRESHACSTHARDGRRVRIRPGCCNIASDVFRRALARWARGRDGRVERGAPAFAPRDRAMAPRLADVKRALGATNRPLPGRAEQPRACLPQLSAAPPARPVDSVVFRGALARSPAGAMAVAPRRPTRARGTEAPATGRRRTQIANSGDYCSYHSECGDHRPQARHCVDFH